MTQLLVSVRSAAEAEAALLGGAALIDVKEPANGSLGRAEAQTIAEVVRVVADRAPVSAALGELLDDFGEELPAATADLAFVKWGLAGCGWHWQLAASGTSGWHWQLAASSGWHWQLAASGTPRAWWWDLAEEADRLTAQFPFCQAVAVAYADWQRASAPPPEQICAFALWQPAGGFLLDTWGKDGSTLLDWISLSEVTSLCQRCRRAGVAVALAGSLGPEDIRLLKPVAPDWFAVRGAVCSGRDRTAAIDGDKVRRLAEMLREPVTSFHPGS